jgi:hypothetical protein
MFDLRDLDPLLAMPIKSHRKIDRKQGKKLIDMFEDWMDACHSASRGILLTQNACSQKHFSTKTSSCAQNSLCLSPNFRCFRIILPAIDKISRFGSRIPLDGRKISTISVVL